MWGRDRRASPCTCALTRMVGAAESSFSYCRGLASTLLNGLLERGGKGGAGTLTWERLSSRTRGCQGQCFREQISTVALEWGWGIALLALVLPPGSVRYLIVVLQGPVCVSSASCACREALFCFLLWFYSEWWWICFY